jgi:hypothetical protein
MPPIQTPYRGFDGRPVTQAYPGAQPTSPVPEMPADYQAGVESPYEYWVRVYGQAEADRRLKLFNDYIENEAQGPGDLFPGLPKNPNVGAPNLFDLPSLERAAAGQVYPANENNNRPKPMGPRPQPTMGRQLPQEQVWWTYPQGGGTKIVRSVVQPGGFSDYLTTRGR